MLFYYRQLPAHRIGRCWKFKLVEVDEWVRVGKATEEEGGDTGTTRLYGHR